MSLRIPTTLMAITTLLNGLLPVQAQPYEFYNDPNQAQMCLSYQGQMCQTQSPDSSGQYHQSSSNPQTLMCELESPVPSNSPPPENGNQLWLYEIDGEAREMTPEKYEALMFKRRLDGVKYLRNPGGALGYLISRGFSDDQDKQLQAAQLGSSGFNVLTSPFDRSHLQNSPISHTSGLSRNSRICK